MSSNAQTFRDSMAASGKRTSTRRLVTSITFSAIAIGVRSVSALRGYDVCCVKDSRPLTPRRRFSNAAMATLNLGAMAANTYWLLQRRDPSVAAEAGPKNLDTSAVVGNVIGSLISVGLGARQLRTGTSLVRKHPASQVGTVVTTLGMVSAVEIGVENARVLYSRRSTLTAGLKALVRDLAGTGPTLSDEEIDRLLFRQMDQDEPYLKRSPLGPQDAAP